MIKVQCTGRTNSKECLDCSHHDPHEMEKEYPCSTWQFCSQSHNRTKVRCLKVKEDK